MANKRSRTKLDTLKARARVLDSEDLASVSGGLKNVGGIGGGINVCKTEHTITDPCGPNDIYRTDDE